MKKAAALRSGRHATRSAVRKQEPRRRWSALCGVALCLVILCCVVGVWTGILRRPGSKERFVIVVDAGSTGTRIYAFRYNARDPNLHLTWIRPDAAQNAVPERPGIRAYDRVETLPGLQSIAVDALGNTHNTSQLFQDVKSKALGPLLNWAKAVIPRSKRKKTSIRLLATAGVRSLNDVQQEALLHVLRDIIVDSGFKIGEDSIEIMSGHEEGVFGWIAVNHELGTFNASSTAPMPAADDAPHPRRDQPRSSDSISSSDPNDHTPSLPTEGLIDTENLTTDELNAEDLEDASLFPDLSQDKLIGVLDLGGSSLEVTFPTESEFSTKMHIAGSQYWLESRTFERLGLNNAFQTSMKLLTENANATSSMPLAINHPCLHQGFIQTLDVQSSKAYINEQKIQVTINGQPDWNHCMELANKVVAVSTSCEGAPCFGDANDWVKRIRFVGLNGFHVVWSFFDLSSGANLSQLEHKGQDFCSRSWNDVQKELKEVVQFETYCFRSAYLSALMHKIMGYGSTTPVYIAPESVSWPIGAAFLNIQSDWRAANSHHRKLGPPNPTADAFLPHILRWLLAGIVVILVASICLRVCRRRFNRDSYESMDMHQGIGSHRLSHIRRGHEIKRRNFSYKRLHDLSTP